MVRLGPRRESIMFDAVVVMLDPGPNHVHFFNFIFSPIPLNVTIGLLKVGVPKTWEESKKDLAYIRKAGVRQFISTYNRVRHLKGDELLWVRL